MGAELRSPRSGIALVGVVLLMLGTIVLAHGLLVLARFEVQASRAGADHLSARAAAELAVATLVKDSGSSERWRTSLWSVGDSSSGVLTDPTLLVPARATRWSGRLRRLSREIWLVEGTGRAGPVTRQSVATAVWILDPSARVSEATAVVTVGDTTTALIDGTIDGSVFAAKPALEPPGGCADRLEALDSVGVSAALPAVAYAPPAVTTAVGRLGLDELVVRAPHRISTSGTPAPSEEMGECRTDDAWNWGDPGRPAAPCGGRMVLARGAPGVRIEGGVGQGLLVLEGDATFVDAEFYGVIASQKRLFFEGDTRIVGLVRAGGGAQVGSAATLVGSACWASAAFGHPAVTLPIPLDGSGWIGSY
jgi:hypothetical protein